MPLLSGITLLEHLAQFVCVGLPFELVRYPYHAVFAALNDRQVDAVGFVLVRRDLVNGVLEEVRDYLVRLINVGRYLRKIVLDIAVKRYALAHGHNAEIIYQRRYRGILHRQHGIHHRGILFERVDVFQALVVFALTYEPGDRLYVEIVIVPLRADDVHEASHILAVLLLLKYGGAFPAVGGDQYHKPYPEPEQYGRNHAQGKKRKRRTGFGKQRG